MSDTPQDCRSCRVCTRSSRNRPQRVSSVTICPCQPKRDPLAHRKGTPSVGSTVTSVRPAGVLPGVYVVLFFGKPVCRCFSTRSVTVAGRCGRSAEATCFGPEALRLLAGSAVFGCPPSRRSGPIGSLSSIVATASTASDRCGPRGCGAGFRSRSHQSGLENISIHRAWPELGERRPASQAWTVFVATCSSSANSDWVMLSESRAVRISSALNDRTTGRTS